MLCRLSKRADSHCNGSFRQCAQDLRLSCSPLDVRSHTVGLSHLHIPRLLLFHDDPEAAALPQAAVLAEVGDVLLLDMRQPVRTETIAEQMVRLNTIKDGDNPNGTSRLFAQAYVLVRNFMKSC